MLSNGRECKCKTAKIDRHIKGAKVPGNESSRERKFHRTFVPGCEKAWVRKGQGANWLGSERARERKFQGANWPGSHWPIRSGERIGPGAKRLGTQIFIPYERSFSLVFWEGEWLVGVTPSTWNFGSSAPSPIQFDVRIAADDLV